MSSGRGRAAQAAESIVAALRARRHEVTQASLDALSPRHFDEADGVVVVGGDGTLHAVVDACVRSQTPVYHAPAGTENLFAREFGMTARASSVVDALESGRRRRIDVAFAGERAFVVMASIGFDASVIQGLDAGRKGSISHLSYAGPIWQALVRFPRARLTVDVDGERLVAGATGLLVVANSRQYAMRLDPARRARVDDGVLDVVFLPFRSRVGLLRWLILTLAGVHLSEARAVCERAERVSVRWDGEAALQLDGEVFEPGPGALEISIQARALEVVVPGRG